MVDIPIRDRRAARVLLLDGRDQVLLFRGCDPRHPDAKYWFTVGGGVEANETDREAACRELREETGIRCQPDELIGPLHEATTEFEFDGRRYRQRQIFFGLRIADPTVDVSGFEEIEAATMDRHAWWSSSLLRSTNETFYPADLPNLMDSMRCHGS
jgi:8-oxo-dGTP pyrophosphatase MutT (NUDIX family)